MFWLFVKRVVSPAFAIVCFFVLVFWAIKNEAEGIPLEAHDYKVLTGYFVLISICFLFGRKWWKT